jgi:enamine deaminase RidA (YjgF/YER057c/UK114 family)
MDHDLAFDEKLESLGLTLPEPVQTVYNYQPLVIYEGVAYVAAQIPKTGLSEVTCTGQVGAEVTETEADDAARLCALHGLSWVRHELGGLSKVRQVLRLVGYVAVAPGFLNISNVVEPASKVLIDIFGDSGRHARSVVGVERLPRNSPVLIEMTLGVKV